MAVTIAHKNSVTAASVPAVDDLLVGEFAINIADGAVFIKTTDDEIVDLLTCTFADGGEITAPGTNP
jgi:hypothetical protein